jgi:hypothetical protein
LVKYHFSQGRVFADERAFTPVLTKSGQNIKLSVLLVLRGQRQTKKSLEEKSDVQSERQE